MQVATAVLSITAKQKKKEAAAKKATGSSTSAAGGEKAEKMEVEGEKGEADKKEGEKKEGEKSKEDKEKKEKDEKDKPEATFDMLNNPARVMKPQLQVSFLCPVGWFKWYKIHICKFWRFGLFVDSTKFKDGPLGIALPYGWTKPYRLPHETNLFSLY